MAKRSPRYGWKYTDYKAAGICPTCKSKPSRPEGGLCQRCADVRHAPHRKAGQRTCVNNYKQRHRAQGLCDRCHNPAVAGLRECQECVERALLKRRAQKKRVIEKYGGACCCCQEAQMEFLTIDHVDGGGAADRRSGRTHGAKFYATLIREARSLKYRVLCMNCNFSLGNYGYCPHVETRIWPLTDSGFLAATDKGLAH
jgi:hypothetical protein